MNNQVELDERDMFSLSDAEKHQKSKEFAEGNIGLEDLLLFLWNHKTTTYACCGGHAGELVEYEGKVYDTGDNPYVLIGIENMTDDELRTILGLLCLNKDVYLLEVNCDKREFNGTRQRKYIDIQLYDVNSSMQDITAIFYGAMEEGFVLDISNLSDYDKEFIESSIALKNTEIETIELSEYKRIYKHFPEKVTSIMITRNAENKPKYEVKLRDRHVTFYDSEGLSYVCSKAFYRSSSGTNFVVDENGELVPISNEQIEGLGLIDIKKYTSIIYELFEVNQKAFENLLKSVPEKENENIGMKSKEED